MLLLRLRKWYGRSYCKKLAADGFNVAILSSSGKGEALANQLNGLGITGSNQSIDDVQRLIDETLSRWGRIDVLLTVQDMVPARKF